MRRTWLFAITLIASVVFIGALLPQTQAANILEASVTRNASDFLVFKMTHGGSPVNRRVYIDVDRSTATGFQFGGIGADYMIENTTLYDYPENGGSPVVPVWAAIAAVPDIKADLISGSTRWRVPVAYLPICPGRLEAVFQNEKANGVVKTSGVIVSEALNCPTRTPTTAPTNTTTLTNTPRFTVTNTPTVTKTFTVTNTLTATRTFTATNTPTATKTFTATNTPTVTMTSTATSTPTVTKTSTNTP